MACQLLIIFCCRLQAIYIKQETLQTMLAASFIFAGIIIWGWRPFLCRLSISDQACSIIVSQRQTFGKHLVLLNVCPGAFFICTYSIGNNYTSAAEVLLCWQVGLHHLFTRLSSSMHLFRCV